MRSLSFFVVTTTLVSLSAAACGCDPAVNTCDEAVTDGIGATAVLTLDSSCAPRTVYVAPDGNDSAAGTKDAPVATLRIALRLAAAHQRPHIIVAAGTYTDAASIVVPGGLDLHGGYDRSKDWQRGEYASILTGASPTLVIAQQNAIVIDRLVLSARDGAGSGASSIAMWVSDANGIKLADVEIRAGKGARGSDGKAGSVGADGLPGLDGQTGNVDDKNTPGAGGAAGTNVACPAATGGAGGAGGQKYSNYTGLAGRPSSAGNAGGSASEMSSGCNGRDGGDAPEVTTDGTLGGPGVNGSDLGALDQSELMYTTSNGTDGASGTPGPGGGGGGGSSGQIGTFCTDGSGNGGGGGGAGGCGGGGGTGGSGGGASIGIVVLRSKLSFDHVHITTGGGGDGGLGAKGGDGGQGAKGGIGPSAGFKEIGKAGMAAAGRAGGTGGNGGGGGGGPSIGIWAGGAKTDTTGATLQLGPSGKAAAGAGAQAKQVDVY